MKKKIIAVVLIALFSAVEVFSADDEKFKPLDYFSPAEIVANGISLGANMYLYTMRAPSPAFGPPNAGTLDYEMWEDSRDYDHEFYEGASDILLITSLGVPAITYTAGIFSDKLNIDNAEVRLLAYLEALNFSQLFTNSAKKLLGRDRPDGEDTESFFSGHTSTAFMAASFFSWDTSVWLRKRVKDDAWIGLRAGARALPFAALYTAAGFTGYYRIAAEKHWFSDVMTGALVGAGCGNFFYLYHFRADGSVKKRSEKSAVIYPIIGPEVAGIAVNWRF